MATRADDLADVCDALASRTGAITFAAGSRIFEQGEPGDCAYLIEKGHVEVYHDVPGGRAMLAVLGPGEIFGEMALLDGRHRSATATALHETTVVSIPAEQVQHAVDEASPLARVLVIAAINRLRATQSRALHGSDAGHATPDARYVAARSAAAEHVRLRLQLEDAIEQRAFQLVYQPIVSLADGRTAGFEALLRWPQPDGPPVSPAKFIPVAEDTGLIVPLGLWALEAGLEALRAIAARPEARRPSEHGVFMSVNVSPRQLDCDENIERLAGVIERAGVDSSRLKLEITEQTLLDDPRMATIGLARLKATGARIAIDDFGTGYSSLNYLHRFPLDTLKIDRSFVTKIHEHTGGQRVVSAIIGLARELEMDVVAEGIEEIDELRWLQSRGCHYGQGYLMAKPSPFGDALACLGESFEW